MAKKKSSLGKGLDSLIPDIYDENFSEDSSKSLEEILNEKPKEKKVTKKTPAKKVKNNNVKEVQKMVEKNPRITLWSAQSAAVFRYLRKTEPEFSISKEASKLIDEAVSKKYPEIWKLFDN